jgi:protein-S-isoprenylcysteine O-methyltransferase Ste14
MTTNSLPARDMKIKVCICGLTNETTKVNRNRYHNNIAWTIIGIAGVTIFLPVFVIAIASGEPASTQTWFEVSAGVLLFALGTVYRFWRVNAYLKKGHRLWCAIRGSFIGIA